MSQPWIRPYTGRQRDCRQSFWHETAHVLEPLSKGTRILSEIRDYGDLNLGACMSAFENEMGGRVVVSGYYPWFLIHNLSKSGQMKRVFSWLSKDRLPALVQSFSKLVIWARGLENPSLIIINASLDPVESPRIRIRSRTSEFELVGLKGDRDMIQAEEIKSSVPETKRLVLGNLGPWNACMVKPAG